MNEAGTAEKRVVDLTAREFELLLTRALVAADKIMHPPLRAQMKPFVVTDEMTDERWHELMSAL